MLNAFLNNPESNKYFSMLKSEVWNTFSDEEKFEVYNSINKLLCEFFHLDMYNLSCKYGNKGTSKYYNENNYENVLVIGNGEEIIINDIDYNQYLTLFELLFNIFVDVEINIAFNEYGNDFDQTFKEEIKNELNPYAFGQITVHPLDEEFEEYSNHRLRCKSLAEQVLFYIVKNNFDYSNCYDEQVFMAKNNILINDSLIKLGKSRTSKNLEKNKLKRNRLFDLAKRIDGLRYMEDMSFARDEDLFMIIYPSIADNIDIILMVKVYGEIIRRIYGDNVSISNDRKKVTINDTCYTVSEFRDNAFNIVLKECLKQMDFDLKNNRKFLYSKEVQNKGLMKTIKSRKKKWLYKIISRIDIELGVIDFGILKYASLNRLVEDKNIDNYLDSYSNDLNNKRR